MIGDVKILKGKIIISRASGGQADDKPIHISIEDDLSGCRVLDIYMALDEFAKSITASYGAADIQHFPMSPIGKKVENKSEIVPFNWTLRTSKEEEDAALAPFEVDGWKARRSDLTNHHCRTNKGQRVVFFRYVEVK
jgi:hypothetical protein